MFKCSPTTLHLKQKRQFSSWDINLWFYGHFERDSCRWADWTVAIQGQILHFLFACRSSQKYHFFFLASSNNEQLQGKQVNPASYWWIFLCKALVIMESLANLGTGWFTDTYLSPEHTEGERNRFFFPLEYTVKNMSYLHCRCDQM